MKGIASHLLDMIKKPLKKASKRDKLELKPETEEVEMTIENLVSLLIAQGQDEKHIENLKFALAEMEKVDVRDGSMTTEEVVDFLKKKKEYAELLDQILAVHKPLKEKYEKEKKASEIAKEAADLEMEHNEAVSKLETALTRVEAAIRTGDVDLIDTRRVELFSLITTINKDREKLGMLAEEYKRVTEEELEVTLDEYTIDADKVKELYILGSEKKKAAGSETLNGMIDRTLTTAFTLAHKDVDVERIKAEADKKRPEKADTELTPEELLEIVKQKKDLEAAYKTNADKYEEAINAIVSALKSGDKDRIDSSIDKHLTTIKQLTLSMGKLEGLYDYYQEKTGKELDIDIEVIELSEENFRKIMSIAMERAMFIATKEPETPERETTLDNITAFTNEFFELAAMIYERDTVEKIANEEFDKLNAIYKVREDPEETEIEIINAELEILREKFKEIHATKADDPSLEAKRKDLVTCVSKFIANHMSSDLIDIKTLADEEFGFQTFSIIRKNEAIAKLDEYFLTEEQKTALRAKKGSKPEPSGAESDEEKKRREEAARKASEELARKAAEEAAAEAKKREEAARKAESAEAKKEYKDKYLNCLQLLNMDVEQINQNNELLSRMVSYNPEEMTHEIDIEASTYILERNVLDYQLELSRMRMDYYKKFGEFLLSDSEILEAKQERVVFGTSANLESFIDNRNRKIVYSELDIIDLSEQIEALKASKEPGYEVRINELEQEIKTHQAHIRTQNSIIQRRLVAEGKSIDVSEYYKNNNEKIKLLREELKKERSPRVEPKPVKTEPTEDLTLIKKTYEGLYLEMVKKTIQAVLEGDPDVELTLPILILKEPTEEKERLNREVHEEYSRILVKRVKEEQLEEILYINQQLAEFYKKTVEAGKIPTDEEVKKFCEGVDKKGLKCTIDYDLTGNRFIFTYTHKELRLSTATYEEVTKTNESICIFDKRLKPVKPTEPVVPREMTITNVKYDRRTLTFSPKEEAQKTDTRISTLISSLSDLEITRFKNKLRVLYTEDFKNQLKNLKANIQLLNTKNKKAKKYDMEIGETPIEGKYASEATVRGTPNFNDYALSIDVDIDGEKKNIQLDLEDKVRVR